MLLTRGHRVGLKFSWMKSTSPTVKSQNFSHIFRSICVPKITGYAIKIFWFSKNCSVRKISVGAFRFMKNKLKWLVSPLPPLASWPATLQSCPAACQTPSPAAVSWPCSPPPWLWPPSPWPPRPHGVPFRPPSLRCRPSRRRRVFPPPELSVSPWPPLAHHVGWRSLGKFITFFKQCSGCVTFWYGIRIRTKIFNDFYGAKKYIFFHIFKCFNKLNLKIHNCLMIKIKFLARKFLYWNFILQNYFIPLQDSTHHWPLKMLSETLFSANT